MPAGVRPARFDRGRRAGQSRPVRNVHALQAKSIVGGRYRLDTLLHKRASSEVWRAADNSDGSLVALKVLRHGGAESVALRALENEYETASTLAHPNICRAEEWIETARLGAVAFDYLAGGDLVSLAGTRCRHWLPAMQDLTCALKYLHGRGLVHRDVKSRNVMFDDTDCAKLIDFGSAVVNGSPWHADGTTMEHRKSGWVGQIHTRGDDVYALAGVAYEMLYAAPPGHLGGAQQAGEPATQALAALVERTLSAAPSDANECLSDYALVIESAIAQVYDS